MSVLEAIEWKNDKIRFLDQRFLPGEERYVETSDPRMIADAMRSLAIRGAPLIGIAAAYGVVLAMRGEDRESRTTGAALQRAIDLFAGTRPTAVNLFRTLDRLKEVARNSAGSTSKELTQGLLTEARRIHEEDREMCKMIGKHGAELLPGAATVLTHCNTGSLATGGTGTALSIIRTAWEHGTLKHVYIDETRPLLQGSRLTAWELIRLGIPCTLNTDSAAAFLMQQGKVNAVVVGADRIAANGDVANKIGTYALAVLAAHHRIPMFVAAPTSSIDFAMSSGKGIPIEQRSRSEIVAFGGTIVAPGEVDVYAPAFDVTPSDLVTAIVTEQGVLRPPYAAGIRALKETAVREGMTA